MTQRGAWLAHWTADANATRERDEVAGYGSVGQRLTLVRHEESLTKPIVADASAMLGVGLQRLRG